MSNKIAPGLLGAPAVLPEVADQPALQSWNEIAPCDDQVPPAGRQGEYLFADRGFND